MKHLAVINDNHIGTVRATGTTVQSAAALRAFTQDMLVSTLDQIDTDLVVNGDLFDGFQVALNDAFLVMTAFERWLTKGHKLTLLPGNHDLPKDSSKLSTFMFVARILERHANVQVIEGAGWVNEADGVYAISHVPNQDIFDLELSRVPQCRYLLLHCNWDNGFAKELDHSLNLSRDVAEKLPAQQIILGHEHAKNRHLNDRVWIAGVQWPTSVSDCLDKQSKSFLTLTADGPFETQTWDYQQFNQVDWRNLATAQGQFIRVTGTADESEAVEATENVARFRRVSDAFVVSSAVRYTSGDQELDMTEALASVEDVRGFDVMGALKELLEPAQFTVLEKLK